MKIKVRLSDAGLRDAERQIQEYKTTLNQKAQEFARALAQKGIDVATVRFANAQYAGDNDVTVEHDPVQTPTGFAIVAHGKAVAFIEFGTGAHHNGYGGELPPGVGAHGSYGKGQGANRRWYYYGESGNAGTPVKQVDGKGQLNYTSGNEPAMAMWGAVEEMASQVEATWREVWNS